MPYYLTWGELQKHLDNHFELYNRDIDLLEMINYLYQNRPAVWNSAADSAARQTNESTEQFFMQLIDNYQLPIIPKANHGPQDSTTANNDVDFKEIIIYRHFRHVKKDIHRHDYFEVNFVYRGSCSFSFDSEERILGEGCVCIIAPHSPHFIEVSHPEAIVMAIMIHESTFNSKFLFLLAQDNPLSNFLRILMNQKKQMNYLLMETGNHAALCANMQNLALEYFINEPYSNICSFSWVNIMLTTALRHSKGILCYLDHDIRPDFPVIHKYIQTNFTSITLSELARHFHYSETYLCQMFRKNLRCSFGDAIKHLKMSAAADYLINTRIGIEEIAENVGYHSSDHFSRIFRSYYQKSPSIYRREHWTGEMKKNREQSF